MSGKLSYEELEKKVRELEEVKGELENTEKLLKDEIISRRLLIEESRDGIVIIDQNCKVYEVNKKFADMLGYTMDEVRDLYIWDWEFLSSREEILELARTIDGQGHHFETRHRKKDGEIIDVELSNSVSYYRGEKLIFCICRDITPRKISEKERERHIKDLQEALNEIKTLRGILPLCSFCKKIRDDDGYWEKVDVYISKHSHADISHSICPDCIKKYYPELKLKKKK